MRNTLLSWSSKSAYTCVLNKYWLLLLFWNTSLFLLLSFFKLFPLYLTSRIQVFSRIPSTHLTLNTLLGPVILPWVSPQVFTAGFSVLLRHLQIFWQSQINQLNSVLCLKPAFPLLFCILLTILCWYLTIAMGEKSDRSWVTS